MKGILAGLSASFVALTLFFLRWPLSGIDLALYDRNFQWFWAEPSAPSEIVIVSLVLAVIVLYFLAFNTFGYWLEIAPIPLALLLSFAGSSLLIDANSPSR